MKEPQRTIFQPSEYKFEERTETVRIPLGEIWHPDAERLEEDDTHCEECCTDPEKCAEESESCPCTCGEISNNLEEMSLQDVIDKCPKGVDPKDVSISYTDIGGYQAFRVWIEYNVKIIADPKGFKKATEAFKKAEALFLKDMESYKQWKKEQVIKKLEDNLQKLKNS